jgi:RNA polymerase sigma factor (sigma-70 family)
MIGDEAELYRTLAPRLERIVRGQVRAPSEVVEDACHHAWTSFINHSESVGRDTALAWLVKTATRQAWKLNTRERREASLEAVAEPLSQLPGPDERVELRERLAELGGLPERQRRLVWLRAAGLSHVEMSAYTGDTVRTVQRQLLRATDRMREFHAERAQAERARADRERAAAMVSRARTRAYECQERGLER